MSDYRDALAWADAQIAAARDDPGAPCIDGAAVPRADRPGTATPAVPARLWTHFTAPPLPLAARTTGPPGSGPNMATQVAERRSVTDEHWAGLEQVAGWARRQLGTRADVDLPLVDVDRRPRPAVWVENRLRLDPAAADPQLAERRPERLHRHRFPIVSFQH
jgi:hypothetical protein